MMLGSASRLTAKESLAKSTVLFGDDVIACDPAMLRALHLAQSVAPYDVAVLVTGETGSGKEVVARTIHRFSARSSRPWIDVNCAALPEHLVESELFGYEKGAFSGAESAKPGLFEMAGGGTLFLDEIGEIDPRVQVKLLRVLDSIPFYRLGGTRKVAVDVRLIAATNRNLKAAVESGSFRRDLYHRITECQIAVPPLRERPLDIPALAAYFLSQVRPDKTFDHEALEFLSLMTWPGNVRELRNVVMKLAIAAPHDSISADDLRLCLGRETSQQVCSTSNAPTGTSTILEMERRMIVGALEANSGNQSRAAQQLGIPRRTFCRKLDEYQITLGRRRTGENASASHRVEFQVPVQVVCTGGNSFEAESTDVSAGGIGLRSATGQLVVGDEVRLRFALDPNQTPLCATATVAWARPDGTAGAQFIRIGAAHRHALLRWMAGLPHHYAHHSTAGCHNQLPV
jgi:two-component system, NtrC family, response regulator AtoC